MSVIEFKRKEPVSEMQRCSLIVALELLNICEAEEVKCSVDIQSSGYLDYFISIVDEIPKARYEELDGGDCLTVDMGNTQISFDVTSQFFKDIEGHQIMVSIWDGKHSTFFLSNRVSRLGIQKAKRLVDPEDDAP